MRSIQPARSYSSRDSVSSFEIINHETLKSDSNMTIPSHPKIGTKPVRSFAELTATIHPPDQEYDTAEKPWLPEPQKPYLLYNAKLVNPRAGVVHEGMSLHLAGGKVVKVAPTTSHDLIAEFRYREQQVEKIDSSAYFLCPGLIYCERFGLAWNHGLDANKIQVMFT